MLRFARNLVAKRAGGAADRAPWKTELAILRATVSTLPHDFAKTSFLRTYTGGLIPLGLIDVDGLEDHVLRTLQTVDFASFDPAVFFPWFHKQMVPAECGMTCFFYLKLLHSLGFKAWQYTFGFREAPHQRCLHSVVLVEIAHAGSKTLVVQDPYFNLAYCAPGGEPLDFFAFLSKVQARQYDRIAIESAPVTTFLLVPDPALYDNHLSGKCKQMMLRALSQPGGQMENKIAIARNYASLMQSPCDHVEDAFLAALRDHGYPEPFLYAYTFRAGETVGSRDPKKLQNQIDAKLFPRA